MWKAGQVAPSRSLEEKIIREGPSRCERASRDNPVNAQRETYGFPPLPPFLRAFAILYLKPRTSCMS